MREWEARWQPIDSVNDDGIDGLIFLESRGMPTGQIIFAQVKCTSSRITADGDVAIPISKKKLSMNLERWRRVVGAAILVHVNPDTLSACWVNLKDETKIGGTQVFVPTVNKFDRSSRKQIGALCGTIHRDLLIPRVRTFSSDFRYLVGAGHIQTAARAYYKELNNLELKFAGGASPIRFTREGWHHITRPERSRLTQIQSFQLLGAVQPIIQCAKESDLRKIFSRKGCPEEFVYLVAAVSFPHRHTGVVKIIFWKRFDSSGVANYSFRTIYEPRRRRTILGVRLEE